ncbi:hypothetical protein K438DRAFT_2007926 [Mycena galopus ATCC 62051]|nr:hypothetical protein K438DRAFT_2007926 [Mycena galopus ATCC 62051]
MSIVRLPDAASVPPLPAPPFSCNASADPPTHPPTHPSVHPPSWSRRPLKPSRPDCCPTLSTPHTETPTPQGKTGFPLDLWNRTPHTGATKNTLEYSRPSQHHAPPTKYRIAFIFSLSHRLPHVIRTGLTAVDTRRSGGSNSPTSHALLTPIRRYADSKRSSETSTSHDFTLTLGLDPSPGLHPHPHPHPRPRPQPHHLDSALTDLTIDLTPLLDLSFDLSSTLTSPSPHPPFVTGSASPSSRHRLGFVFTLDIEGLGSTSSSPPLNL